MNTEPDPITPGLALALDLPALHRAIREATKDIDTATEWLAVEENIFAEMCQSNPLTPGSSIRMKDTPRGHRAA